MWYIIFPMPANRPHGHPLSGVGFPNTKPVLLTFAAMMHHTKKHSHPHSFEVSKTHPAPGHCPKYKQERALNPKGSNRAHHPHCG